ncbi:MAG: NifU family protein [Caldilineaceae bacterium]
MNNEEVRARVAQAEALLAQIENLADPQARTVAMTAVQILLELYGEGLARMMAQTTQLGSDALLQAYTTDELISHLLLLHDLHPATVEERIEQALDEVRPYMADHGGSVELLGVEAGVARLRLLGSCSGCPASTLTLQQRVEQAIEQYAPDLVDIEVKGITANALAKRPNAMPIALEGIAVHE